MSLPVNADRIRELEETQRSESHSQSDQLEISRKQLEDTESILRSTRAMVTRLEEECTTVKTENSRLRGDLDKQKDSAKEEEEKRIKAITLLKTVRQKLVKTEKERDDVLKDLGSLKEKEKQDRDAEKVEKAKLEREIVALTATKDKEVAGLRAHFDRELSGIKERLESEMAARKGQMELEVASLKVCNLYYLY